VAVPLTARGRNTPHTSAPASPRKGLNGVTEHMLDGRTSMIAWTITLDTVPERRHSERRAIAVVRRLARLAGKSCFNTCPIWVLSLRPEGKRRQ
jgi:hypothetical protein